jgi:hypothetical protein
MDPMEAGKDGLKMQCNTYIPTQIGHLSPFLSFFLLQDHPLGSQVPGRTLARSPELATMEARRNGLKLQCNT